MSYALFFFFFKQKTAYEMRISDWSSDVCSSDLDPQFIFHCASFANGNVMSDRSGRAFAIRSAAVRSGGAGVSGSYRLRYSRWALHQALYGHISRGPSGRSEEHTSELQSLMRISYAVFCLKKKKRTIQSTIDTRI